HCDARHVIGIRDRQGAFAEKIALPIDGAIEVPDAISDELAVLLEPLAAALRITTQVPIGADDRVLVVGAGRLGILVAQVLGRLTRRLDVLVRSPGRRASFSGQPVTCVEVPVGRYDVVVECSGNQAGFQVACRHVRPRGTLVLKSTYAGRLDIDASPLVVDEITVVGSRCGDLRAAIDWLSNADIDLSHLTFETFSLEDHAAAFEAARRPAPYKVLFAPN
ncbi:MAG: zinc-binding dehydrogenase, partial [Pseudomonadales bacterium]|nr:zinc-binding dehydrogenase [Pseudomonadales bacterium]